jgi:hypothetical protein
MAMTSPGSSVMAWVRSTMVSTTGKIMLSVLSDWSTWPLSRLSILSPLAPGGSAAASITHGPNPPVWSKFLPMSHWLVRRWKRRIEPSLKQE